MCQLCALAVSAKLVTRLEMPQISTLEHIADIVIQRTINEVGRGTELIAALERAYPFPDEEPFRETWDYALRRHGITVVPFSTRSAVHRR